MKLAKFMLAPIAAMSVALCAALSSFGETYYVSTLGSDDNDGKSPCTDAAEPMDWMAGATDLKGRPRTLGEGPDIGCYESTGIYGLSILVR